VLNLRELGTFEQVIFKRSMTFHNWTYYVVILHCNTCMSKIQLNRISIIMNFNIIVNDFADVI
jgi:hypothetical protein